MAEENVIRIQWHIDRTKDPADYTLVCLHPDHPDLTVRLSSADVTERVAKARLMEMLYNLAAEQGIPGWDLRFKINGVE